MAKRIKSTGKVVGSPTAGTRYEELKRMLKERQRELLNEVQGKINDVRAYGAEKDHKVLDSGEIIEINIQEDIEITLIQMKTETLNKISLALARLEEGTYGHCAECGDQITEKRLRALPLAIRCKDCEGAREIAEQNKRPHCGRNSFALFVDPDLEFEPK